MSIVKFYFLFFILCCSIKYGNGQKTVKVSFSSSDLKSEALAEKNIELTKLAYYTTDIELLSLDRISVYSYKKCVLVDNTFNESTTIELAVPENLNYSYIRFQLGVDSLINMGGALGGDLDPINGMYWTWQNGYINFKLEGTSSLCPSRNNKFTYHLGGYQSIHSSVIITLPIIQDEINVMLDLVKVFESIDFAEQHSIMSPTIESKEMIEYIGSCFKLMP